MDYPVKTVAQLKPLLLGFRKAAGLTQSDIAMRLGITQQTYAQLESRPESASMERLFKVLRLLGVSMTLQPDAAISGISASDVFRSDDVSPADGSGVTGTADDRKREAW